MHGILGATKKAVTQLPRVGIVHAPSAAATVPDILSASVGRCKPIFVFPLEIAREHKEFVSFVSRLTEASICSLDEAPSELHRLKLEGLVTFDDRCLEFCDELLLHFGLPGAPGESTSWDKLVQRQRLREAGVSHVRSLGVDSREDFRVATAAIPAPCVLKPKRASGGEGLSLLLDNRDLEAEFSRRSKWAGLVVEELIPFGAHPSGCAFLADYVSVETVSTQERRIHVAVSDKPPLAFLVDPRGSRTVRETGDFMPSCLSKHCCESITDLAGRALSALGVWSRVTHTEIRLLPGGAEVIEVNGRLGGEVNRLLRILRRPDLVGAALDLALGRDVQIAPVHGNRVAGVLHPPRPSPLSAEVGTNAAEISRLAGVIGVQQAQNLVVRGSESWLVNVAYSSLRTELPETLTRLLRGLVDAFPAGDLLSDPWWQDLQRGLDRELYEPN